MSKNRDGSLGYQMMKALQGIFHPGASRHNAKKYKRDDQVITSISTMRCMSADVHQFARFIRSNWPAVKRLSQVDPDMALAYIQDLEEQGRSGGRIGRVCASIRKLDAACHQAGILPADSQPLLPYKDQDGPGGFHSKPKPIPYTEEQSQAIISWIEEQDSTTARLLTLMWKAGLRVLEATYLHAQDIDLENGMITLNQEGNVNRTKGGRPRQVRYPPESQEFMSEMKDSVEKQPSGHIFSQRRSMPARVRAQVRNACRQLDIPCLGTHGFRKSFGVNEYLLARSHGADDRQALLAASKQLGHNRVDVTYRSYIPPRVRRKGAKSHDE